MTDSEKQAHETFRLWLVLQSKRAPKAKFKIWGVPSKEGAEQARKDYLAAHEQMGPFAIELFGKLVAEHTSKSC